jgi:hypothetical protein
VPISMAVSALTFELAGVEIFAPRPVAMGAHAIGGGTAALPSATLNARRGIAILRPW